jgi:glycerol-3-phosphate O-acyltransferase
MTSSGFMKLVSWLLHPWVRLRIVPEGGNAIDPARPVCYVLAENWWSDRWALYEAARRSGRPAADQALKLGTCRLASAEFSLTGGWRLFGKARDIHGLPPRLARLIQALASDATADVQIVPVSVMWGRAPKQQDGILCALLAESWQRRHPLGHWLAVLLHGRHTLVHFGQPYSLRTLLRDAPDPAQAAKKAARLLRVHFRRQRELAIGPDVSHRQTQVAAMLATPEMRAALAAEAERRSISLDAARERARRHILAIASDYSYSVMRAGEIFLTWVWTRLFDGVEVRNLDVLLRVAPGQSVVYLPCHRSHIDYLLMSYVIFRAGLSPPHIAAGDNLDMPILGRILRGGGAFFLRRSFKGDPLYATVFAEYLHHMLAQGFPLEYFIEGGRSRNGRMLPPKAGLLAMTVHSFLRRHERPLVFVPIYLGYEKLPEGASFVGELSGQPKRRESLLSLLSAVRVLRRHFGKVYVNFGAPLPLADWLDSHHPDWRTAPHEGDWQRDAVGAIALELTRRINAAAVVNPANLVGLALLATPRATAGVDALARQIEHLQSLIEPDRLAAATTGIDCISAALKLAAVRRIEHPLGALIEANAHEAAQLAYFRNNVLHLYALPSLIACLLVQHGPLAHAKLLETIADLFGLLRTSLYLRQEEGDLPFLLEQTLDRLAARGLIEHTGDLLHEPGPNSLARADLHWLAEILRPQMERYFLVLMVLSRAGSGRLTRAELLERSVLLGQRLALMQAGKTPEFADKPLFVALVDHLLDNTILREDALQRLSFGDELERAAGQAEALLAPDVRELMVRLSLD